MIWHSSLTVFQETNDRQDHMTIKDVRIENDELQLAIIDSLRSLNTKLNFSLSKGKMNGISKSSNNIMTQYKHWDLSRQSIQNGMNLMALDSLMQSFQSDIEKRGDKNLSNSFLKLPRFTVAIYIFYQMRFKSD